MVQWLIFRLSVEVSVKPKLWKWAFCWCPQELLSNPWPMPHAKYLVPCMQLHSMTQQSDQLFAMRHCDIMRSNRIDVQH